MESSGPEPKRMKIGDDQDIVVLDDVRKPDSVKVPTAIEECEEKTLPVKEGGENNNKIENSSSSSTTVNSNVTVSTSLAPSAKTDSTSVHFSSESALKPDATNLEKKLSTTAKPDFRGTLQNGSGQKLESIIDRLCSDRSVTSIADNTEEPLLCRVDASTQTFPDFVKIVKNLVFRRMKQLEQSLIGDAVTDSVLNGKLIELQKENRDLRRNARRLQDKLDAIIQSIKTDDNVSSSKLKEVLENVSAQPMAVETGGVSPIRRQSAVVSPYHVQKATGEANFEGIGHRDARPRAEVVEISRPSSKTSANMNIVLNDHGKGAASFASQGSPITRQGPQVKYVPQRLSAGSSAVPHSQFIHLGQNGMVMQKVGGQRPRAPGIEFIARPPGQMIYTTQPVQVTGPRMSTIPPQPQQAGQHTNQRQILSPSGMGSRLSQPGQLSRPGGNLVRMQGSSTQTVHYIPQNVMPGFISHTMPPNSHRMPSQVAPPDMRPQVPLGVPQRGIIHSEFRARPGASGVAPSQLPPPPYQMTRVQVETPVLPKLQVNITVSGNGIVLSWDFETEPPANIPAIDCYHLFASQDSPNPPTVKSEWKKIGVVKALPLPMACTLTQFVSGNSYHFAVLPVDVNGREGQMSNPCTVRLNN